MEEASDSKENFLVLNASSRLAHFFGGFDCSFICHVFMMDFSLDKCSGCRGLNHDDIARILSIASLLLAKIFFSSPFFLNMYSLII
jgi:hypothetical protein